VDGFSEYGDEFCDLLRCKFSENVGAKQLFVRTLLSWNTIESVYEQNRMMTSVSSLFLVPYFNYELRFMELNYILNWLWHICGYYS